MSQKSILYVPNIHIYLSIIILLFIEWTHFLLVTILYEHGCLDLLKNQQMPRCSGHKMHGPANYLRLLWKKIIFKLADASAHTS